MSWMNGLKGRYSCVSDQVQLSGDPPRSNFPPISVAIRCIRTTYPGGIRGIWPHRCIWPT